MFLTNLLRKASPDVADLYDEIYVDMIMDLTSMSLHDLCVDFGVCPYHADSLNSLQLAFGKLVMSQMCKDERFLDMPVQDAFHCGTENSDINFYVLCSNYCEEEDVTYYLTLTDVGTDFWINVDDSLLGNCHRIDVPNSIGDILDSHIF